MKSEDVWHRESTSSSCCSSSEDSSSHAFNSSSEGVNNNGGAGSGNGNGSNANPRLTRRSEFRTPIMLTSHHRSLVRGAGAGGGGGGAAAWRSRSPAPGSGAHPAHPAQATQAALTLGRDFKSLAPMRHQDVNKVGERKTGNFFLYVLSDVLWCSRRQNKS